MPRKYYRWAEEAVLQKLNTLSSKELTKLNEDDNSLDDFLSQYVLDPIKFDSDSLETPDDWNFEENVSAESSGLKGEMVFRIRLPLQVINNAVCEFISTPNSSILKDHEINVHLNTLQPCEKQFCAEFY